MPPMPCPAGEKYTPESLPPMNGKITGADCASPSQIREAGLPQKISPASGTRSLPPKEPPATASDFHWLRTLCRNTTACSAFAAARKQVTAGRCLVFSCLPLKLHFKSPCFKAYLTEKHSRPGQLWHIDF